MMFTIVILLAHTFIEFMVQTDNIVKMKKKMNLKGYFYHGLSLILIMLPILLFIKPNVYCVVIGKIILVVVAHIVIDIIKELVRKKLEYNIAFAAKNIILFISEQLIYILVIFIITKDTTLYFNSFNDFVGRVFLNGNLIDYSYFVKAFIVLYISFSGAYCIPCIFDIIYSGVGNYESKLDSILEADLKKKAKKFDGNVKTGKWIGILERLLILIFLFKNELSVIGFIIAVKSLCRFKLMEDKVFSEYYIIGTMISLVYTLVLYSIFTKILI